MMRPALVVLITAVVIAWVTVLVQRVDTSRRAQISLGVLTQTAHHLETVSFSAYAPFNPDPRARSENLPLIVAQEIQADETQLARGLTMAAHAGAPASAVASARASLTAVVPAVATTYKFVVAGGLVHPNEARIGVIQNALIRSLKGFDAGLSRVNGGLDSRARQARIQAEVGSGLAMVLLVAVFGFFYFRSERLARENEELLGHSREEASTDALTGLGNRRALTNALKRAAARQEPGEDEVLLAMYDLNGFKQYNDTFGHAAGDALLTRLGGRLSVALEGSGSAYRMGGDEFCILAHCPAASAPGLLDRALAALTDSGEGWTIDCSQGAVWMPSEATTQSEALQLADERMYAHKATRSSAGRQLADVLLQVLSERDQSMDAHGGRVSGLASDVARVLGQPDHEIRRIGMAATLHDIGKAAIPETVLQKAGPLNERDWEFVQRHTLIGERIVLAAPALADTAPLIRASHERIDGGGYPDGLQGADIPLGAKIIAVCDSFDAMTTDRPYRKARSVDWALAELRRCAGSQFDPVVVEAFCELILARPSNPDRDEAEAASAPAETHQTATA